MSSGIKSSLGSGGVNLEMKHILYIIHILDIYYNMYHRLMQDMGKGGMTRIFLVIFGVALCILSGEKTCII